MSRPEIAPQKHDFKYLAPRLAVLSLSAACTVYGINNLVSNLNEQCPAPSPSALAAVAELYDHPEVVPSLKLSDDAINAPAYDRYMQDKQRQLDIQLPSYSQIDLNYLSGAIYSSKKRPFTDYESATRGILDQIDIPLYIGLPPYISKQDTLGAITPTTNELETLRAKNEILMIAAMFGREPKNITRNIGIKAVAIVAHSTVGGLAITDKGVLITDITNVSESDRTTPFHEFAHLVDAAVCGSIGMHNDPAYASLNRQARYAQSFKPSVDFVKSQPKTFDKVENDVQVAYFNSESNAEAVAADPVNKPLHDHYCRQKAASDETVANIDDISEYSETFVTEDKAEVGKELFDSYTADQLLHRTSPTLRAKGLLFLARMYQRFPNSVKYMALNPVNHNQPVVRCDKSNDYQLVH